METELKLKCPNCGKISAIYAKKQNVVYLSAGVTVIGNRWVKQIQNPEDSEDPKNAFEEAAETIAQRIAENELDIGYINRNAKKNEVNK